MFLQGVQSSRILNASVSFSAGQYDARFYLKQMLVGMNISIMELGHIISGVAQQDKSLRIDAIPKNYQVLFITGGATTQFAMVPLNLFGKNNTADYVDTGIWSKKAMTEAKRYGNVNIAATIEHRNHLSAIPAQTHWSLSKHAAYLHYTPNETIDGLEFHWIPETGDVPLVADMTSMILSRPVDVTKFGIIYASTQKNMGQAGQTVVIIRDDLIQDPLPHTPTLYSYKAQAEQHSFYNTPPTYCWYMMGLVLAWMKRQGGVQAIYEKNKRNAEKIYSAINSHSGFYSCRIEPTCRSMTNIMFYLCDEKLTPVFLEEATHIGLVHLRGHRVSGGVRASMYNAMPEAGATKLAEFMIDFAKRHA